MKTPWETLSARRSYTWILSVSIHLLIFSIPVAMVTEPQRDEMELFVSIEEVQVPPEPVKKPMAVKKPRSEPAKEMVQPIEPSPPKIEPPEIIEPVKEVVKEPEMIKPVQEIVKKPEVFEPIEEVLKEPVETEQKPVMLETKSQPATETRETLFVPPVPKIPEKKGMSLLIAGESLQNRTSSNNRS